MEEPSPGPRDPDAVSYRFAAHLFGVVEQHRRQAAAAVAGEVALRQVAGDVGRVLLRMADDPRLLSTFATPGSVPSVSMTKHDLLQIPWNDHLERCGYTGQPPAEQLVAQLIDALTDESSTTPRRSVKDLQYLLRRLGAELAADADTSPTSSQEILHRIGTALWAIVRIAVAAVFAAVTGAALPVLAPAAPLIAVVVHQVAPEIARAVADQVMPHRVGRPEQIAGEEGRDVAGILASAPESAKALVDRWRAGEGPADPALTAETRKWCDAVQSALFARRYHDRVRGGGDGDRRAADATWKLRQCLQDAPVPHDVADAVDRVGRTLEAGPADDPSTELRQPRQPQAPAATAGGSVGSLIAMLAGHAIEMEAVMDLLALAGRDLEEIRDRTLVATGGSTSQRTADAVDAMSSLAERLAAIGAAIPTVVADIGGYCQEIGDGPRGSGSPHTPCPQPPPAGDG